jgi:repressor LexA
MGSDTRLSDRQERILAFLLAYSRERGWPPSRREIMGACGLLTTSAVTYHLSELEASGFLVSAPRVARGLRLTGRGARAARRALGRQG